MSQTPRIHLALPLDTASEIELPVAAVRHLQVRRLQPGDALRLFDGRGGEWQAELLRMGRQSARVRIGVALQPVAELRVSVTLALGVPANDRMDRLVEKACELGVAAIQPLVTERSVLRLSGERAAQRCDHWQSIAVAACEQCGRAQVPTVAPWMTLAQWLAQPPALARWLLSPEPEARPLAGRALPTASLCVLSGPEGGLSPAEQAAARASGFEPVNLGPRVLRADTAPLVVMAWLSLLA
jgi:16S rRNA (uracil1498-N3)-methyltransferase